MRLFWINCLLLATVATAVPNGRHKRDFSTIRNWIRTAIFGRQQINIQPSPILKTENEYKLYRLPGFDEDMVKVVPRTSVVKEFVYPHLKPVNLNAFGSVVGTKSNEDTLVAVKKVNNLLRTGILNGNYNHVLKESVSPLFPTLNTASYVTAEKTKTVPVIEKISPVLEEVIQPYEEKIELKVPFEPKYSYKQTQNNEPVMTYTAHNNPNVKVVETFTKTDLPMCLKERIDEVIVLGANPNRLALGQEVYQPSPVVDISYPRVETNMYIDNPTYEKVISERLETIANSGSSSKPVKDSHIRRKVRVMKRKPINPRPVPLYSHSSPDSDAVKVASSKASSNSLSGKTYAFTNSGDKVELPRTLGPIPPQYLTSNVSGLPKRTKVNQTNIVRLVASKDDISNGMIPDSIYKYQSNPNTGKMVKEGDALKTDVKTNTNYYFVPSTINQKNPTTQITKKKDGAYINNVTVKPQTVIPPAISSSISAPKENLLKENDFIFYKGNPTVVPDTKTYSYKKKNADGSSISIVGSKNGVLVDVTESKSKSRGDIPDEKRK